MGEMSVLMGVDDHGFVVSVPNHAREDIYTVLGIIHDIPIARALHDDVVMQSPYSAKSCLNRDHSLMYLINYLNRVVEAI